MKHLSYILLLLMFTTCIHSEDSPLPEEDPTTPYQTDEKNICDFDLSDKAGEFELHGLWEFAGFQNINSDQMDNLTCLARVADYALSGEDDENLFKVILKFSQDKPFLKDCNESTAFEATSFGMKIQGCYQVNSDNLNLNIPRSGITEVPGPASNTFPVLYFDEAFLNGLQSSRKYHIDKNKLYLYDILDKERMVFVALDVTTNDHPAL